MTGDSEIQVRRNRIETIDAEIVRLLERRYEESWKINRIKSVKNTPVYDKDREQEIIERASELANELPVEVVEDIMTNILRHMRTLSQQKYEENA